MHHEEIAGLPLAKLVLEMQQLLMRTLRAIVDDMLSDVKAGSGDTEWIEAASVDFEEESDVDAPARFEYDIVELPYGAPHRFDGEALAEVALLQAEMLEDHLKDLQTDPPYMQSIIHELDSRGKILERSASSKAARSRRELFWSFAAEDVWLSEYLRALDWEFISGELVSAVHYGRSEGVSEGGDQEGSEVGNPEALDESTYPMDLLPRVIAGAYHDWVSAVEQTTLRAFPDVVEETYDSKMNHFSFQIHPRFHSRATRRQVFTENPMMWAVVELFQNTEADRRLKFPPQVILGFLGDLMTDGEQRSPLNSKVLIAMEDILLLYMFWHATLSHRPGLDPSGVPFLTLEPGEGIQGVNRWSSYLMLYMREDEKAFEANAHARGKELQAAYESRWPKGRQNAAWTKKATTARARLQTFWDGWREYCDENLRKFVPADIGPAFAILGLKVHSAIEEPVDVEDLNASSDAERHEGRETSASVKSSKPAEPEHSIRHSSTVAPPEKFVAPTEKRKRKTVGTPGPEYEAEEEEEEALPSPTSPKRPKRLMTKKSYDTLGQALADESGYEVQGTTRFKDFAGMVAEAALSIQPAGGSVYTIKQEGDPSKGEGSKRMNIHRPHRDGDTVDPHILRIFGRRLRDKFGLRMSGFGVKGKDG